MKARKKTYRRYCVIKNCNQDFGLGKGVIARDEVTYTDEFKRGFKHPLFGIRMTEDAIEMLKDNCTVLVEPKRKGAKWRKNPNTDFKKQNVSKKTSKR